MKKTDYIEMLTADVQTEDNESLKRLYEDIIDCVYISLAEESDNFQIDGEIALEDLYKLIESKAREEHLKCVGPFEAAELFAKKFGSKFNRPSKRPPVAALKRYDLEDFL